MLGSGEAWAGDASPQQLRSAADNDGKAVADVVEDPWGAAASMSRRRAAEPRTPRRLPTAAAPGASPFPLPSTVNDAPPGSEEDTASVSSAEGSNPWRDTAVFGAADASGMGSV